MVACQAPLSMKFSRQEYWSGLPFPSPGYLPNPGIEPGSPALQADSSPSEPPGKPKRVKVFAKVGNMNQPEQPWFPWCREPLEIGACECVENVIHPVL